MSFHDSVRILVLILGLVHGSNSFASTPHADTALINKHLKVITKTEGFRNHRNVSLLNKTADYIFGVFEQYADTTYFQEFVADGKIYKNVISVFGSKNSRRIVVGAHYDVCENQEGADDNASGVVGLLELSRLLKDQKPNYRIELVAYTLEEPPYFRTKSMGSYIHARSLHERKADVYGMISLEMIGFFKDEKKTQSYPVGILKLFYGSRGNYITLVNKFGPGKFARKFSKDFKRMKTIRAKRFKGPASLSGIDFSDHLNYWSFDYSAMMITDTAFYRNKAYHETIDKMETLDIVRMGKVIDGVFKTLTNLN